MFRNAKLFMLPALIVASAFVFAACSGGGAGAGDNSVAATVNGKAITLKDIDQVINQQAQGQQSKMSSLQLAQARLQVLESLIQKEVLVQRAFARRRQTLENNLRDSYPNLNQHLRLLNLAGSRRAETLSVGEFASLLRALS